ncbi:MFS transporter [Amycolatopsis minnesotensis]|uniref:MFS transporter n=1 Tax=Amycolatopsis minnesotensis TaxID=337894 RepID=A0ABN2Q2K4_9PSEU
MRDEKTAGRREWIGLGVLALPTLLVSIDVFVMLMALPRLSEDLHADGVEQLWIVDSYGFMIAGFLITMGNLGDRIGRRRLLLIGAVGFGLASVLAAFSVSAEMLIAARALLGIAGATLMPSTLALISTMFAVPRQRAVAISVWMVCFMGGAAIGPLVGGVLLEHFWWGSVFLLGVPAMVLLLVLGPLLLPEHANPGGSVDLVSVALSLATILPIIYGLKELARDGLGAYPACALLAGLAFGAVFVRRQQTLAHPLLDLRLFRNRVFSAALGNMLFGTFLMGAIMLFISQYFQLVQGLTPLVAGLCMLPAAIGSTVSTLLAPILARRFRPAYLIAGGLVLSTAGLVAITRVDASSGLPVLLAGFMAINLGAGPMVVLGTDLVVGSVAPEKAGAAGSLNETAGEFGFALGIAVLGSIGAVVYRAQVTVPPGVPPVAADAGRQGLAEAVAASGSLHGETAVALLRSARESFTAGLNVVAGVSAVLLLGAAFVALGMFRSVPPHAHAAQGEAGNLPASG